MERSSGRMKTPLGVLLMGEPEMRAVPAGDMNV